MLHGIHYQSYYMKTVYHHTAIWEAILNSQAHIASHIHTYFFYLGHAGTGASTDDVIGPPAAAVVDAEAMRVLDVLLAELPPTLAARLTSKITGRSKAELYKMTLALKPQDQEDA